MDLQIEITNLLNRAITNDENLQALLRDGSPGFETIVRLLTRQLEHANFAPRFLLPGKSGAKVLLMLSPGGNLDQVIKFSAEAQINEEIANYLCYVQSKLDPAIRPELVNKGATIDGFAAFSYTWAGGTAPAESFKSFFVSEYTTFDEVRSLLHSLSGYLAKWHAAYQRQPGGEKSPVHPLDAFKWHEEAGEKIREIISTTAPESAYASALIDVIHGGKNLKARLGELTKRDRCSIAMHSHGDLNFNNLLAIHRRESIFPAIIDFASVRFDLYCPARDWARLARDIKFRALANIVDDARSYSEVLRFIDSPGASQLSLTLNDQLRKYINTLRFLENEYTVTYKHASTAARFEYVYHLLCWSLAFIDTDDFSAFNPDRQLAVVQSAGRTLDKLEQLARTPNDEISIDTAVGCAPLAKESSIKIQKNQQPKAVISMGKKKRSKTLYAAFAAIVVFFVGILCFKLIALKKENVKTKELPQIKVEQPTTTGHGSPIISDSPINAPTTININANNGDEGMSNKASREADRIKKKR